ncbi:hyaluronan-mediated motility receptor-like [Ixodes scapularis]
MDGVCGPGVGDYAPKEKHNALCAKFLAAERFRHDSGSAGTATACGTPFKAPATPMHLPKEKLRRKMAELLQQLEDRDRLISQLRVSKNKLSAHVGQLEGLLRNMKKKMGRSVKNTTNAALSRQPGPDDGAAESFAEADVLSRDAVECTTELRLTKDTQELRKELGVFVESLEDETGYADAADRDQDDQDEMVSAERIYQEQAHDELLQQVSNFMAEISLLRQEKEEIQKQQEQLQNRMTTWQIEQTAAAQQQTELAQKLQQDVDNANASILCLEEMLRLKTDEIAEVSKTLEHERTEQAQATAVNLQLGEDIEKLMSLKVSLESELATVKAQCEEIVVDREAAENVFLQAKDTITELKEQLSCASDKEDCLVAELIALKAYLTVVETEKQEIKEDLASVLKDADTMSAETSKLGIELCTLRSDKSSLEGQVTKLVAEKEELQKEVSIQRDRADVASTEGEKLNTNLRILKEEQRLLEENFQAREKVMQEQVVFLQAEVERLKGASRGLQQELGKALSDLSASYNRERETREQLHNVALELEEERTCSATLHTQIAMGVRALTELQSSQEQLLGQVQETEHREARTAGKLECALAELRAAAAERTDLAKACDDLRKASDLKAEQIATLERKAKRYVVVSRELEQENRQLCKDLQDYSKKDRTEVSILQKRLEDSCAEAQRWKNDYELLQARVAPFQLQLELYDVERRHLAERNQATESELSKLHHKFSELMGHQNHKQKIHYLTKVTEERQHYQAGVLKLQEQNLKQMKLIQKLELEVKRCSLKPPLASHKENLFP